MSGEFEAAEAAWDAECAAVDASAAAACVDASAAAAGSRHEPPDAAGGASQAVRIDTSDVLRSDFAGTSGMGLSGGTATALAAMGVLGASADALQHSIMGQVNRAAQAKQEEAQRKRKAREAAARSTAHKHGTKKASAVEARMRKEQRKTRQQELATEGVELRQQIAKAEDTMARLEGSRETADKLRRMLAAKRGKLKAVEGEQRVLELLGQKPFAGSASAAAVAQETERERLIRTGKITPFQKVRSIPYQSNAGSRFMGGGRVAETRTTRRLS